MTLAHFDAFPGRSKGYATLPEELRRQFAADVPRWSQFIATEAARFNYPYIDTFGNFSVRIDEAIDLLRG